MPFNTRKVPKYVLLGKSKRYMKVHNLYRAVKAREIFLRLHESFLTRSEGEVDPVAGVWQPLAKRTLEFKENLELHKHTEKNLPYGLKLIYDREIKRVKERQPELKLSEVKKLAMEKVASSPFRDKLVVGEDREYVDKINIRTGRLLAATRPGTVIGGRYYTPVDQTCVITLTKTKISLDKVPYARDVALGIGSEGAYKPPPPRPIIPPDMTVWINEAHEIAITEAEALYLTMKAIFEANKKQRKPKAIIKKPKKNKPDTSFDFGFNP